MTNKRRFRRAGISDVIGSGFAGYLEAEYRDLVEAFGQPHWRGKEGPWRSGDGKVRCEWALTIGTGKRRLVFTIYDYKNPLPIEKVILSGMWGPRGP